MILRHCAVFGKNPVAARQAPLAAIRPDRGDPAKTGRRKGSDHRPKKAISAIDHEVSRQQASPAAKIACRRRLLQISHRTSPWISGKMPIFRQYYSLGRGAQLGACTEALPLARYLTIYYNDEDRRIDSANGEYRVMRTGILAAVSIILLSTTAPSLAQVKSAEQITCEITGECAPAEDASDQKMGREAGFAFTRSKPQDAAPAKSTTFAANPAVKRTVVAYTKAPAHHLNSANVTIGFALGSAEMTAEGRAQADLVAKSLSGPKLSGSRFVIAGHTDAIGSREYNLKLSEERAQAVTAYLTSQGVEPTRLEAKGYGFDQPLPGRPKTSPANRRVQIMPVEPVS